MLLLLHNLNALVNLRHALGLCRKSFEQIRCGSFCRKLLHAGELSLNVREIDLHALAHLLRVRHGIDDALPAHLEIALIVLTFPAFRLIRR